MKCKLCTVFRITIMCLLFTFAFGKKEQNNRQGMVRARALAGSDLKQDYDNRHKDTPKTPVELATGVMSKLYKMEVEDKGGIPTMQIMYKLDHLRGPPRLQTLLMFEKMDKDSDGTISAEEFISMYGGASSAPHRVFRALFKLFDYDNNNSISVWEILRYEATLAGFDSELTELGKNAEQKLRAMDGNGDAKVSEDEFVTYMAYLGANAIEKVKKDGDSD